MQLGNLCCEPVSYLHPVLTIALAAARPGEPFKENCWTFCATADKLLTDLREITQPLD